MLDFGLLPPEVNSGRMYSGPGPGPLLAAAEAWDSLAAELGFAANGYGATLAELTSNSWVGPTSAAMTSAVTPYIDWVSTTAAQAEETANHARAAVAAYEAAFAMTVPPPVIAANRALLAALVATNFFGQNTPAIMMTEALYAEMWAQDAAAMYGYAASSASAGRLSPLTSPTEATDPGGLGAQTAAVSAATASSTPTATLNGLVSELPNAVQALAAPAAADPLGGFFSNSVVVNTGEAIFDTGAWNMFASIADGVLAQNASAASGLATTAMTSGVGGGALVGATSPAATAPAPVSVSASLGSASAIGKLSAPAVWSAQTPAPPSMRYRVFHHFSKSTPAARCS